jgi:hypothetical protein
MDDTHVSTAVIRPGMADGPPDANPVTELKTALKQVETSTGQPLSWPAPPAGAPAAAADPARAPRDPSPDEMHCRTPAGSGMVANTV